MKSEQIHQQNQKTRQELAACYRMFARRAMDDLIYTHLSARLPGTPDRFLFIPFGMLFDEVTASNLMEVDLAGSDVQKTGAAVNPAGWIVHKTVYEAVPEGTVVHSVDRSHQVQVASACHWDRVTSMIRAFPMREETSEAGDNRSDFVVS